MSSRPDTAEMPRERLLRLVQERGSIRAKDLESIAVPRVYLQRLCAAGLLEQSARGLYRLADAELTEQQSMIEVCQRVPQAVICLISALQYHGLTTQVPHAVWIALSSKAWSPKITNPQLQITRYAPAALSYGVLEHRIDKIPIKVFHPAKTVADCFKFRNKVGLDVALEALRDALRLKQATRDGIWQAAAVCRVQKVIRPYLESV